MLFIVLEKTQGFIDRGVTSFSFLWSWSKQFMDKHVVSIDATAPDIDRDVPYTADPPVIVISCKDWLCMSYKHFCFHLLASVEIGTATFFTSSVTQDLCYRL